MGVQQSNKDWLIDRELFIPSKELTTHTKNTETVFFCWMIPDPIVDISAT